MTAETAIGTPLDDKKIFYNRFLLIVAGLGGLLYGVDVGIIAGALPYLEATSGLNAGQLSIVVAAVLLGSVISTLFAGLLADWMGRKSLMALSGVMFVISIPMIALAHGYGPLVFGRLLQGVSAGLIGVVVPLYLAECLTAANRGKGTGIFQWLLTLGIAIAALVGFFFSLRLAQIVKTGDLQVAYNFKDSAWRGIFWVSLPPGILFVIGSLMLGESPRWLFRRGKKDAAYASLLRSRTTEQADLELKEMQEVAIAEKAKSAAGTKGADSLLRRKYVIPFVLACIILACNQATGINSIIAYNANILLQSGLSDFYAHLGYVIFTCVNFTVTAIGVALVDRKGRKFLLGIGTAGIIVSLICTAAIFLRTEKQRVDAKGSVQAMVTADQKLTLHYDSESANRLSSDNRVSGRATSLVVIYSCGDFRAASAAVRSDDLAAKPIEITRDGCVPANKVVAFFSNPFGNLDAARVAPLKIENALITPVPSATNGWMVAITLFVFMAFFAIGPGVCVWLALSELMPTRIRSNGMSIALLLNQAVSTAIAAVFLPTVGKYGYSTMFFGFAACTVIYFVTATWFLPETKGKTLEEIEAHFEGGTPSRQPAGCRRYCSFAPWLENDLLCPITMNPPKTKKNTSNQKHSHAMRREIYEQPTAIAKTVAKHLKDDIIFPGELDAIESALLTFEKLIIAASGSSRHAGLAGEIMIEDLSGVAVDVEYASEYCYRSTHAAVDPIVMVITQSGETADTIAAQREALTRGVKTIAISNVPDTTIVREAGAALISGAGPELSIPATKSFTTQLTILYLMALFLARKRGRMTSEVTRSYLQRLMRLPEAIEKNLATWDSLAEKFGGVHFKAEKFLYLGRGVHYAIAREGALKLKEISYAHAEGYPAGELKHGPNALVDEKLPVVVLATCDHHDPDSLLRYRRTLEVMKEVRSRRGPLVTVATEGDKEVGAIADHVFYVPAAPELLLPIVEVIPLQLFAYHVAVNKGYDVDHPRNLVKAVVTE